MLITDKCTGCGTCEKVCTKKCILMQPDDEGFFAPVVDSEKCISCGVCRMKCPQNLSYKNNYEQKVYAAKAKDENVLKKSASGGAFSTAALYVIENDGVVFGAGYNEDFDVIHMKAENIEQLKALQSSKYVQSNTASTYIECKEYLNNGRLVLYSGTPCQIAGLMSYLNKDYSNLITMDLICHGVPSSKLFKKYINWLSKKMGAPIKEYDFRPKEHIGWRVEEYKVKTELETKYIGGGMDPYYSKFIKGSIYRDCCYECKYANLNRVGDITIGDYWGIGKFHHKFYDAKGVSALIINSAKGADFFDLLKDRFEYLVSDMEKVSRRNENLKIPTPKPAERDYIYKDIDNIDEDEYFSGYFKIPVKLKIKTVIKKCIPSKWIHFIKSYR